MQPSILGEGSSERPSIEPSVVEASKPPAQPPTGCERKCRNGTWLVVPNSVGSEDATPSCLRSVRDPNYDWFARGLSVGEMMDGFQGPSDFDPAVGAEPPSINVLFDPYAPVDGILDFDLDAPLSPFGPCTNNQGQTITCPPLPDLEPESHPDPEPESGEG